MQETPGNTKRNIPIQDTPGIHQEEHPHPHGIKHRATNLPLVTRLIPLSAPRTRVWGGKSQEWGFIHQGFTRNSPRIRWGLSSDSPGFTGASRGHG